MAWRGSYGCEAASNNKRRGVNRQFTVNDARKRLKSLYLKLKT